jgi:protein TIF31
MSDTALSVRVNLHSLSEGAAPLELDLLKSDVANDVYAAFGYTPQVHHITSFDLLFQGQSLDPQTPLAELLSSEGQSTLTLDAKPKAYTSKSIVEHLVTVRGIVGIPEAEPFSINPGISKVNDLNLDPITDSADQESDESAEQSSEEDKEKTEEEAKKFPPPTDEDVSKVNELINTFFTELPDNFTTPSQIVTPAVRSLYLSAWNPVPLNYRTKGHLVYIQLQTFESEILHITGSTSGFYVNKSSSAKFDPAPREVSFKSFNLYDLISKASKNFLKQIKQNNDKLSKLDPVTFLQPQTTYLSTPWITKPINVVADFGRTQFNETSAFRDFNDEIQSLKEFPGKTLQDKIICERLLAKTAFEFTNEAVKGALSVLSGGIAPMEQSEDPQTHIFLHNGIFYSYAVDSGSFAEKGGNEASRASSNQDLQTLNYLNQVESKGIYTLMTTIVDYAGKRVVCQTPVPGLFASSEPLEVKNEETGELEQIDGEPLTKIDYGRDENEGSVKSNKDFVDSLETIREVLHFKKQTADDAELVTSPDVKGMTGTDKRKYIIDLYNATPLDIEFIEAHYKPDSEDSYPHKQTVVRLEAIQQWWSHRINDLITEEAKAKGIDLTAAVKEGDKLPEVKVDETKLFFGVDAFQTPDKEDENVRDLSKFIKNTLIPKFINQFDASLNIVPVDGAHLTSILHKSGINIRYLGEIAKQLEERIEKAKIEETEALAHNEELNKKFEERLAEKREKLTEQLKKRAEAEKNGETYEIQNPEEDDPEKDEAEIKEISTRLISNTKLYENLLAIVNQELISRASKHVLRSYSLTLPIELIPTLISHFHNALLGTKFNESPEAGVENHDGFYSEEELSFTKLTPATVKELIEKDVQVRYRTKLPSDWSDSISPFKLQREIAKKFGIQWNQRDYHFTKESFEAAQQSLAKDKKSKKSRQSTPSSARATVFYPEDVSLAPIIKTTHPRATTGEQYFETGRLQLSSSDVEKKKEGLALVTESVTIYEQTYGQVHPEVQRLYATLAQVYRDLKMKPEASLMARRSVSISERVFGLDSHETIVAYLNLAFFEAENGKIFNALKAFARITQIWSVNFDNRHISIPNIGSDIVSLLQERGYLNAAIKLTSKLVELTKELNGGDSYTLGLLKFRLGYLYGASEKFQQSLKESSESHKVLERLASANHYLTKQARSLKDQMVQVIKYQEHNAKLSKEQAKLENEKSSKAKPQAAAKKANDVDLTNKSVDEVLNFVLGKSGSGKKKSKKSKK